MQQRSKRYEKTLEILKRKGTLSPLVNFLVSPFANQNVLSNACCEKLAKFKKKEDNGPTNDEKEAKEIVKLISNDLSGKNILVYVQGRNNLQDLDDGMEYKLETVVVV